MSDGHAPGVEPDTGTVSVASREPGPTVPGRRRTVGGVLAVLALVAFAGFWTWALFFASKDAINKIDDRGWAARAQTRCEQAAEERLALADPRRVDPDDAAMMRERGDLVDRATDTLERMLDDLVAVPPSDDKGRAIVPDWEADYRQYVGDRRAFADRLRAGDNVPFRETEVDGIPISERIATFAGDNEMPACAPPHDLSI